MKNIHNIASITFYFDECGYSAQDAREFLDEVCDHRLYEADKKMISAILQEDSVGKCGDYLKPWILNDTAREALHATLMEQIDNDELSGSFTVEGLGYYIYYTGKIDLTDDDGFQVEWKDLGTYTREYIVNQLIFKDANLIEICEEGDE